MRQRTMIARPFREELDETVRLYFAPVIAIAREFRRALGHRVALSAAEIEERAERLREREADLAGKMRLVEKAIADQRRSLEQRAG